MCFVVSIFCRQHVFRMLGCLGCYGVRVFRVVGFEGVVWGIRGFGYYGF